MFTITTHDSCPPAESAIVDDGLGESNNAAAPLDEVQPISCFARSPTGEIWGGIVGRRWRQYCEIQQLWVTPSQRRQGVGKQLLAAFETHARGHRCENVFLETFSFQSPELYQQAGYKIEYQRQSFPHGIVKYHMSKQL